MRKWGVYPLILGAVFIDLTHKKAATHQQTSTVPASASKAPTLNSAPPKAAPTKATKATEAEDSEALCWKKINAQVSTNNFIEEHKKSLERVIGEWYYTKDFRPQEIKETSTQGKFLLALARAGLLEGKELARNDEEALKLLNDVIKEDPGNSAPYLYAALIEKRLGNQTDADVILQEASMTDRFDSYVPGFSRALYSQVRSPADLLAAFGAIAALPIPDYVALRDYLKDGIWEIFFADQLMKGGLDSNAILMDVEWVPIEYAIGKSLVDKVVPAGTYPRYQDLVASKNKSLPVDGDALVSSLSAACDINVLEPNVRWLRKRVGR